MTRKRASGAVSPAPWQEPRWPPRKPVWKPSTDPPPVMSIAGVVPMAEQPSLAAPLRLTLTT